MPSLISVGAEEVNEDGKKILWEGWPAVPLVRNLEADETTGFRFSIELGIQGPPWCLLSPGTLPSSHRKQSASF